MRFITITLLLVSLFVAVFGVEHRHLSSPFQLYGYGDDCHGMPLYYADGIAYLGDPGLASSPDAAVVNFSMGSSQILTGNPNTTLSSASPSWNNATLFVPTLPANDKRVGFLTPNNGTRNGTVTSSGFGFFGSTVVLSGNDGGLQTLFYGMELESGLFGLYWNDTDGKVPITLRRVAPSKPDTKPE